MDEKGFAEIVSVLLIAAIAVAMSASMIQLTQSISEEIAESISEYSAAVSVSSDGIKIVNPTITPIELSRIKLIVDSQPAEIRDANGNGIWEPSESITLRIEDRNGDGIIPITLLVDGKEVFYTVYAKPIVLYSDERFPSIDLNVSASQGKLRLEIGSQDDSVVSTYKVQLGDLHNKLTPWRIKGLIDPKDIDGLVEELKRFRESGEKGNLMRKYSKLHDVVEIPASVLADKAYIIVYVKDITGKTSSKIVELYEYYPQLANVSVKIISPKDGEEFWEGDTIQIKAVVTGESAEGVVIKVDGKEVLKQDVTANPFYVSTEVNLEPGEHTIYAEAWDLFGKANDSVTIFVRDDKPPNVKVSVDSNLAGKRAITANVQDDRGITKVVFYVDNKQIAIDYSEPYVVYYTFSAGLHRIKAVAYDTLNQSGSDEIAVNFTDNPPIVKILEPPDGKTYYASDVVVKAVVEDDIGLKSVKVEWISGTKYVDEIALNSQKTYNLEKTLSLSEGTWKIRVVAYDTSGNTGADEVTVQVISQPPEIIGAYVPEIGWSTDFSKGIPVIGGVAQ